MNADQEMSLQLIKELLNSMDDEIFLMEYEALEHNIGPTVESYFLRNRLRMDGFVQEVPLPCPELKPCKIATLSHKGQNASYAANHAEYCEQLAA